MNRVALYTFLCELLSSAPAGAARLPVPFGYRPRDLALTMFHKRQPKIGAPPGTLVFRGEATPARVQVVHYSPDRLEEIPVAGPDEIAAPVADGELLWVDVSGIDDPEVLYAGGQRFGLSALTMEDIVNVPQRPKTDVLGDKLLSIAHVLKLDEHEALHIDQLSLVLGPNYLITVHNQPSKFLDAIRHRLQSPNSRLRQRGPDYLAYAVLDAVVDGYYPVLESFGERLEHLEDDALESPQPDLLKSIHQLRSQLIQVRKSSWPMREAIEALLNSDSSLITSSTESYLRNTLSHCTQLVDVVEMYRESAAALLGTYMSSVAHRSNEIMKVLTMMSSIFVPLTFIAGIYGMNFEYMPELSSPMAYPLVLGSMVLTAVAMAIFFLRRGWFGRTTLRVGAATKDMCLVPPGRPDRTHVFKVNEPLADVPSGTNPTHSEAA
ncbi:MAG: magnesium/cobalt transporter CorA [Planctomycetota bacterium]